MKQYAVINREQLIIAQGGAINLARIDLYTITHAE